MSYDNNFFVSIDIGSRTIIILIAEIKNGKFHILSELKIDSAGVKNGIIIDSEQVSQVVKEALEHIEAKDNISFHNIIVNISDSNITNINRKNEIPISSDNIKQKDIDLAIKAATNINVKKDSQIVNAITNHWILDKDPITNKGTIVDNPIGEQAMNLSVEMHIIIALKETIKAIYQSMDKINLGISHIVPSSIASSEACLSKNEKNNGVCIPDIGAETTDISTFINGGVVYSSVLNIGADKITEDIKNSFNLSFNQSEQLKIKHGNAQLTSVKKDKLIGVNQTDDFKEYQRYLSYESLTEVIEKSYLELFSIIKKDLQKNKLYSLIKSGFVLSGGGAKILNCNKLALDFFKVKTKLGLINNDKIEARSDILDPIYNCALGLLLYDSNKPYFEIIETKNSKIRNFFRF